MHHSRERAESDDTLNKITVDRVCAVQQNVTIDWYLKHSVRAAMRSELRRRIAECGRPLDHEEDAIELTVQQAELLASGSGRQ